MIAEVDVFHLPPSAKNKIAINQLRAKVTPINNPTFLVFSFITNNLLDYSNFR